MHAKPPIDPPSLGDQVPQVAVLAEDADFAILEGFFRTEGHARVGRARTGDEAILRQSLFGELIVIVGDPEPAVLAELRQSLVISREAVRRLVDAPD